MKHRLYRCFFFDFDGTLADSRHNIARSFQFAAKELSLPKINSNDIYPLIGKFNLENTFLHFYPQLLRQDMLTALKLFRTYQEKNTTKETIVFDGVRETLEAMKAAKIKMAILTTKDYRQMETILKELELDQYFSVVFGSHLKSFSKPSGSCVNYIRQKLGGVDAIDCVLVGDTTVDYETAKNEGIDSIGMTYGIDGKAILQKAGISICLDTFNQLIQYIKQ